MSKWISVKDRMPNCDGKYLVVQNCYGYAFCETATYANSFHGSDDSLILEGRQCFYRYDTEIGEYEIDNVTHWMTIPELPKEEQK